MIQMLKMKCKTCWSLQRRERKPHRQSIIINVKIEPEYISLKEFWKVVVDETLFSEKSSNERKYWGLKFLLNLSHLLKTTSLVQYLFTPNFMRCLINQHASSTRMLYKIAQQTLKTLVKTIRETKPELGPIVLLCLLDESKGGCWNFDLISKSHTIDEILQIKQMLINISIFY